MAMMALTTSPALFGRRVLPSLTCRGFAAPVGTIYKLGKTLYLSMTNECNARRLIDTRGPGFKVSPESGFKRLPDGYEPDAKTLADLVNIRVKSENIGENPTIAFAGYGEPLLRRKVLTETVARIRDTYPQSSVRVVTNGLVGRSIVQHLIDIKVSNLLYLPFFYLSRFFFLFRVCYKLVFSLELIYVCLSLSPLSK
ncbi:hypothetical protein AAMO2058_001624400 [Amorphochlora amoebiformis]